MVQLNTTYDKDLKQKVFVLKGEEAYARTTDVLADLISDYDDCNSHIQYARVGLEIEVLRPVGDGNIFIFDGNEQLHTYDLPWFEDSEDMSDYYDTTAWANKGVSYDDGKLTIGSSIKTDSGFFIAYDIEHNIKVKYSGNKRCLGSSSELISFSMDTPDLYGGTLTMTSSSSGIYDTGATINDLVLKYVSNGTVSNTKTVLLFDGDTLIKDDISLTNNTASTISIGTLSDGLHHLRAVFMGDDESTYAEVSLDISVGYKVTISSSPSSVVSGNTATVQCGVFDYFNNPKASASVQAYKYVSGSYTSISSSASTNSNGRATLTNVAIDTNQWCVKYGNNVSALMTTPIVTITDLTIDTSTAIIGNNELYDLTGTLTATGGSMQLIPVSYTYNNETYNTYPTSNGTFHIYLQGDTSGDKTLSVSCGNQSKSKTISNVYQYWNKGVKEIDMNYTVVSGSVLTDSTFYKIKTIGDATQVKLILNSNNYSNENYELSFKVNNVPDSASLGVGRADGQSYVVEKSDITSLRSGDVVRIICENGVKKIYLNSTLKDSISVNTGEPVLLFNMVSTLIRFNELLWKKI